MSSDMFEQGTNPDDDVAETTSSRPTNLKITLISLHGLIRAKIPNWAGMPIRAVRSCMYLN